MEKQDHPINGNAVTTPHWNSAFISNVQDLPEFDLALEIGCFKGDTSKYICDNMLTASGKLICVDPLADQYLVENITEEAKQMNNDFTFFNGQYDKFIENTKGLPVQLIRKTFADALPGISQMRFDFIYVDGDHREDAVYFDAVNSFALLKPGGYILFDDYLWQTTNIKSAIDRFLSEFDCQIKLIFKNYQVLIQKKDD